MSEKAHFIVNVLTDWLAIKVGAYVAISAAVLSAIGTVLGVYLGIKLSMKSFYSQKWWERKADSYGKIIDKINFYYLRFVDLEVTIKLILPKIKTRDLISTIAPSPSLNGLDDEIKRIYEVVNNVSSGIAELRFYNTIYLSQSTNELIHQCSKEIVDKSDIHFPFVNLDYEGLLVECQKIIEILSKAKIDIEEQAKIDLKINKK